MNRILARVAAGSVAALLGFGALLAQANERVVYVSAFDEKTRAPITGLGVRDFVIREDGAAREVLRVTPATSPMAVAILVDNTQAATNNIADIRRALQSFVKALDGVGPVSIIGVADRPTILRDYTTDQKQLLRRRRTGCSRCPIRARRCSMPCSKSAAACRSARKIAPRW